MNEKTDFGILNSTKSILIDNAENRCSNVVALNMTLEEMVGEEALKKIEIMKHILALLWLMNIFATLANFIVVMSSGLLYKQGKNRCTYMFMGNLSLADFIGGIMAFLGAFGTPTYKNSEYNVGCVLPISIYVTALYESVNAIFLIALDRFIYIAYSMKYKLIMNTMRARLLILGSWIWSLLFSVLPLFIWKPCNKVEPACTFIFFAPPPALILMSVTGLLVILTVTIMYCGILYVALRKVMEEKKVRQVNDSGIESNDSIQLRYFKGSRTRDTEHQNAATNQFKKQISKRDVRVSKSNKPNNIKAIKMIFLTVGAFAVAWTPYLVASLIFVFCFYKNDKPTCDQSMYIYLGPLTALCHINSYANPIIYAWMHGGFKSYVEKLFKRIGQKLNLLNFIKQ